jgi:hypothetical protein
MARTSARRRLTLALGIGAIGARGVAGVVRASALLDTPEVEIQQLPDINDVYAFPGSNANRIALAVTTASPVTPSQSATIGFDPAILYQIKVDRTGDAVEDLVFQLQFVGTGRNQTVNLYGPAAPNSVGRDNTLLAGPPRLSGATNTMLGKANGIQLQAGLFEDPFFIDLEQFFRIIPDRRPARGPLSVFPVPATSFRNPGIDFLRGINALGIVIELPEELLLGPNAGVDPKLGIWATTSK